MTGRGAWTATGKDNGSRFYEFIAGKPMDGSSPDKGPDYLAVNLGVKALQARLNAAVGANLVVDGILGSNTAGGVKLVQRRYGLTADGIIGPATAKALWRPVIEDREKTYLIPGNYLCGLTRLESVFDPSAVGYSTPTDHGLVQINSDANPTVSIEQAFDPLYAMTYAGKRLQAAFAKYQRWDCAVASYNSPLAANQWAASGTPPNDKIKAYADTIMRGCP